MLTDSTVLVTGATGLIGKTLIKDLLKRKVNVVAVVRNKDKAQAIFGDRVKYAVGDIRDVELEGIQADYIIHTASATSSRFFVQHPVDTISVAIDGTRHLLEFAKSQDHLKRFIYLSSMEVYGTPSTDEKIDELHGTDLNTMVPRTCYPEGKRMCESICSSYASEFGIPVNVVRATQTFGPGVNYDDSRVFAEFGRCAVEGKDIILKTKGETRRNYLYTEDLVNAIFTIIDKAPSGEAYNAANEDTYCSIYEMAELVANKLAGGRIKVRIEEDGSNQRGFAPVLHMNLDAGKLCALGWRPETGLPDMFRAMIDDWKKG